MNADGHAGLPSPLWLCPSMPTDFLLCSLSRAGKAGREALTESPVLEAERPRQGYLPARDLGAESQGPQRGTSSSCLCIPHTEPERRRRRCEPARGWGPRVSARWASGLPGDQRTPWVCPQLQVAQMRIEYLEQSTVDRAIVSRQEAIICDLENQTEFQKVQIKRFEVPIAV